MVEGITSLAEAFKCTAQTQVEQESNKEYKWSPLSSTIAKIAIAPEGNVNDFDLRSKLQCYCD